MIFWPPGTKDLECFNFSFLLSYLHPTNGRLSAFGLEARWIQAGEQFTVTIHISVVHCALASITLVGRSAPGIG